MSSAMEAGGSVSAAPSPRSTASSDSPRRNPLFLLIFTATVFALATATAVVQFRAPYAWHKAYRPFREWAWWRKPLEWNVDAALPQIQGNINAVTVSTNHKCIWIGGDAGLLYFSSDQGQSWTGLKYSPDDGSFRAPTDNFPCGDNAQTGSLFKNLTLSQPVYAAERGQSAAQQSPQQSSSPQQYSPRQSPPDTKPSGQNPSPSSSAPAPPTGLTATVDGGSSTQNQQQQSSPQQSPVQQNAPSQNPQQNAAKPNSQQTNAPAATNRNVNVPLNEKSPTRAEVSVKPSEPSKGKQNGTPISSAASPKKPRTLATSSNRGLANGTPVSNQQAKPPAQAADIWVLAFDAKGKLATLITADGYRYWSDDAGLTWQNRSGWSWVSDQGLQAMSLTGGDKELHILRRGTGGNLQLIAVSGYAAIGTGRTLTWDSQTRKLNFKDSGSEELSVQAQGTVVALSFIDPKNGWALFQSDSNHATQLLRTSDSGHTWTQEVTASGLDSQNNIPRMLRTVHVESASGWVGGTDGILLKTTNGGNSWMPASRAAVVLFGGATGTVTGPYGRFVAPWYWLALIFCAVLMRGVLHPATKEESARADDARETSGSEERTEKDGPGSSAQPQTDSTIGNQAISDKPLEPGELDALGLGTIAAGLSFFLRNEKTKPPLVIGINGRWGSGKSSLMNLLMKDLQDFGTHPVWFNAWHHQKEDQLLAGLLQAVKAQAVPGLMDSGGILFRAKLGWKRLQRYWFHLAVISSVVFLVYRTEMYLRHTLHLSLLTLFYPPETLQSLLHGISTSTPGPLTVLASALAAFKVISAGFTAFGSKPAELLSSVSGNQKIKDLDAQTSFRQRFAAEFEDVTEALGRNRMLILIDDLDRCRPEKVREVLEGVNFLVSSGDCFVVLGMARDIVEHCVGLSFRRVVDTMSWGALGLGTEDVERALTEVQQNPPLMKDYSTGMPGEPMRDAEEWGMNLEIAAKRREFARLYLDKLIQIQVSVPEPTAAQKRILFETSEEQKKTEAAAEIKTQKILERLQKVTSIVGPVSQAALLAAVIGFVGIFIGYELKPYAQGIADAIKQAQEQEAAKKNGSNKDANQKADQQKKDRQGSGSTQEGNQGSSNSGQQLTPPSIQPGPKIMPNVDNANVSPQAGWLGVWPFCLTVLLAFSFSIRALRRMPQKVVHDTAPFANSLANWHPLVLSRAVKNTPRTARRFQNRVRYLAMRQRAMRDGRPLAPGERLIRYLVSRGETHDTLTDYQASYLAALPPSELDDATNDQIAAVAKLIDAGNGKTDRWEIKSDGAGVTLRPIGKESVSPKDFKAWVMGNIHIPEGLLVALAAIHEYEEDFIEDANLFETLLMREDGEAGDAELAEKISAMRVAQKMAGWAQWHNLEHYRRAYLRLCSEISKGDVMRTRSMASSASS